MASTSTSTSRSKSYRRKSKFVPKPKQRWQVKQPTRNWLELPSDLMVNIIQRVGVFDVLDNCQLVCTAWHEICKEPALWRAIYMRKCSRHQFERIASREMCKEAVDRSQGQLADLTMVGFCDSVLLQYVAARSSQLRRLEIVHYFGVFSSEAFKKFSLLEELSLDRTNILRQDFKVIGHSCPLLKTLKVNQTKFRPWVSDDDDELTRSVESGLGLVIGKNLPQLTHLELIGNHMENIGLQAILDGCCHLESLDLRGCFYLDLQGDLGKRCSRQIKHLKLPHDFLKWGQHMNVMCDVSDDDDDSDDDDGDYDDEYLYGYSDYDDYTAYDNFDDIGDMMAFMDMFG